MTSVFVLSTPRCRTAWLSAYLTGAGVFCFHEAWKLVKTAKELRALMESKGPGPVVNADCTNVFFLDELKREFPEAKYLRIVRDDSSWVESAEATYGPLDEHVLLNTYRRAFGGVRADLTIHFEEWGPDTSLEIWNFIAGDKPMDLHWHVQFHGMNVRLSSWQIEYDRELFNQGGADHLIKAATQGG